jgi:hypothetical protein
MESDDIAFVRTQCVESTQIVARAKAAWHFVSRRSPYLPSAASSLVGASSHTPALMQPLLQSFLKANRQTFS